MTARTARDRRIQKKKGEIVLNWIMIFMLGFSTRTLIGVAFRAMAAPAPTSMELLRHD